MIVEVDGVRYLFSTRDMFKKAKSMKRMAGMSGGVYRLCVEPEGPCNADGLVTGGRFYIVDATGANVCNDPNCPGC